MDISTVLNVKNIKLNMTARTKEEVIEELTDLLIQDGAVTNKEDFIRDVWLREEQVVHLKKILMLLTIHMSFHQNSITVLHIF